MNEADVMAALAASMDVDGGGGSASSVAAGSGGGDDGCADMLMDTAGGGAAAAAQPFTRKARMQAAAAAKENGMQDGGGMDETGPADPAEAVMTGGEQAFVRALYAAYGDGASAYKKMAKDEQINVTGEPAGK